MKLVVRGFVQPGYCNPARRSGSAWGQRRFVMLAYFATMSFPISVYPWFIGWMSPLAQNQVNVQTLATGKGIVP